MPKPSSLADRLKRAEALKGELVEFATNGYLKEDYEQQLEMFQELSKAEGEETGEQEIESFNEWFLYDWIDDYGEGVISQFIDSNEDLGEEDEEVLTGWLDSINSVFEIKSVGKNAITLAELDSGDRFSVVTLADLKELPFKRGQFMAARLLPFGEQFIFAGIEFILPDRETAMEALQVRRMVEMLDADDSMEEAQAEQREAFIELFGGDEVTVEAKELPDTIERFQRHLFFERKDAETGKSVAEMFEEEFAQQFTLPELPIISSEVADKNVTLVCDEFDGLLILPDYQKFKRVFESKNPDKDIEGWQDLVWAYVEDPDIPIVAFERIAETHPKQVEKVMRGVLDDKKFSLEHLYAMLLHYKQPAEGFEELEDDQRLWDLFDGGESSGVTNAGDKAEKKKATKKATRKAVSKKGAKKAATKVAASKAATTPAKASAAKKK